jgi:hypothetical protein
MLQELLYLGPEQMLRRLLSSICVQNLWSNSSNFQDTNRAMIVEKHEIKQPVRKRH